MSTNFICIEVTQKRYLFVSSFHYVCYIVLYLFHVPNNRILIQYTVFSFRAKRELYKQMNR